MAADETPKVIPLEDLCPDDFSEEERAKFKAAIEKAEAAIAAAIKPEEVAALRNMMTAARAKWDKEDRSRQETSERLRRHQAPAQIGLFKRLDALLEAVKSLPAPSLWQQEALAALLAALEALKSSPVPTPWQEEALRRLEASIDARKRQPRSGAQLQPKSGEPKGRQISRVIRALRELYPPDGRVRQNLIIEEERGKVAKHLGSESRNLGLADPSWKVVKAAIEYLGRRDD